MCGRYSDLRTKGQDVAARFGAAASADVAEATLGRANIAPTDPVLAVVAASTATGRRSSPAGGWCRAGRRCAAAGR